MRGKAFIFTAFLVLGAGTLAGAQTANPPPATGPSSPLAPLTLNRDGNFHIAPPWTADPAFTEKAGVRKGRVERFKLDSRDSKIYPTAEDREGKVAPFEREVLVYIPAGYKPGTPTPFIVVQDGVTWYGKPERTDLPYIPTMLDNLIAEKRVPAMVAVLVNPGPGRERSLEYDTVSNTYTQFVETELLPKVARDYNITFTTDPEGRATFGESSGAAAAIAMVWFHPELYRRVISYSGTFVALRRDPQAAPDGAWEYHQTLIPGNPRKPFRIWIQVGERDNGYQTPPDSKRNWVTANQLMAKVLEEKGYPYQFVYSDEVGHVSRPVQLQTMPEAFEWAWKGYKPRP